MKLALCSTWVSFAEEQMVKILREADKAPVAEVAKKHGISEVTIYAWRKRFCAATQSVASIEHRRSIDETNYT